MHRGVHVLRWYTHCMHSEHVRIDESKLVLLDDEHGLLRYEIRIVTIGAIRMHILSRSAHDMSGVRLL